MSDIVENGINFLALYMENEALKARVKSLEAANKRLRAKLSKAESDHSWEVEYLRDLIPFSHEMGQ